MSEEIRVEVRTTEWPGWLALMLAAGCLGLLAWERMPTPTVHATAVQAEPAQKHESPAPPVAAIPPPAEGPEAFAARFAKAAAPWDRPCPRCGSRGPGHRDEPVYLRSDRRPFGHYP